jgi:hypothetical protein
MRIGGHGLVVEEKKVKYERRRREVGQNVLHAGSLAH